MGRTLRIGSVNYLNAKPLIWGLEEAEDLELILEVPSKLLGGLREGALDVALLPVIDYRRMDGLVMVPAGGIGCDGATLTVRIFSRRPLEEVRDLACDTDSHTSVELARIVLREKYGVRPKFRELRGAAETMLLIGDKVVCDEPKGYEHQLDLGQAWKDMTGLPFVFAVWTARAGVELGGVAERLAEARRRGMQHLPEIVEKWAIPRGWPRELAMKYLGENLRFEIGPRQVQAIERFWEESKKSEGRSQK